MICVIIPTLNSAENLTRLLPQLAGGVDRLVIADGGSDDKTIDIAIANGAVLALGHRGRGMQLARGGGHSGSGQADWLLFIHCDSRLPDNWRQALQDHIKAYPMTAAYFRYRADTDAPWRHIMNFWVAMRSFWWRLPYGDQGLLIPRKMYNELGGFSAFPLFEDVDMVDRIRRTYGRSILRPLAAPIYVHVGDYIRDGWFRRSRRNFGLLRAYRKGAKPAELETLYK